MRSMQVYLLPLLLGFSLAIQCYNDQQLLEGELDCLFYTVRSFRRSSSQPALLEWPVDLHCTLVLAVTYMYLASAPRRTSTLFAVFGGHLANQRAQKDQYTVRCFRRSSSQPALLEWPIHCTLFSAVTYMYLASAPRRTSTPYAVFGGHLPSQRSQKDQYTARYFRRSPS